MTEKQVPECFAKATLQQLLKLSPQLVTIVDVRNPEEFEAQHIPGAINIPLNEIESRSKELSKQATIVTACGKGGGRSAEAAAVLQQIGFDKANYLCGGTIGWFESQSVG